MNIKKMEYVTIFKCSMYGIYINSVAVCEKIFQSETFYFIYKLFNIFNIFRNTGNVKKNYGRKPTTNSDKK